MAEPSFSQQQEALIEEFAGPHSAYYQKQFLRLETSRHPVLSFNSGAAILGPVWAGIRGLSMLFLVALFVEVMALVLVAQGLWGDIGGSEAARITELEATIAQRMAEAETARAAGDVSTAETSERIAANLEKAVERAQSASVEARARAASGVLWGVALFLLGRLALAAMANPLYEKQYTKWRVDKSVPSGITRSNLVVTLALAVVVYPLTLLGFVAARNFAWLQEFPAGRSLFSNTAKALDAGFDSIYTSWQGAFDWIRDGIESFVSALELILVGTPWPVVMTVVCYLAFRLAGIRVAIFTLASMIYLALFGFWELSMQTMALLGVSAFLCVVIGIPLGIWLARSKTAFNIAQPVLDFMQTMPAFVYLIPVIAFFGTGKPPGVIATLVFGMPPIIRLTTLGLRGVPSDIREAARAYGASEYKLLVGVDLPLALPSIMTGINQTILMCLSMVVIASLIGAQGLGSVVLESLQYAAKGQGLLAGLAILVCAMVVDRIVQGSFRK